MDSYPEECTQDSDCNPYVSNRLCYTGAVWLDQLEANASECQCNHFYSWTGPNCDEYGTGTLISVSVYATFGFASLILFIRGVLRLWRISKSFPDLRCFPLNAANTTLTFTVVGLGGSALVALLTILNFLVVEGTPDEMFQMGDFGRVEFFTSTFALPILGLSCTMSQLNLCLMWLDLGRTSKHMKASARNNLGRSRKIVVIFQVLLLSCLVVGLLIQTISGFSVIAILSAPFTIATIVLYVIGARKMYGLIDNVMGTSSTRRLRHAIKKTTIAIILTDLVFIGSQLGYAILNFDQVAMRDASPPGTRFASEKVFHHMIFAGFSVSNYVLWVYLRPSGRKVGTASDTTLGGISMQGTTQREGSTNRLATRIAPDATSFRNSHTESGGRWEINSQNPMFGAMDEENAITERSKSIAVDLHDI
jgi:hypothetical protein